MINFKEPYNHDDFIQLLNTLLPDFKEEKENIQINRSFKHIKNVNKIGNSKFLDLKIYEIEHESEHDPRVSLSKESFLLMKDFSVHRSLVIFKNNKSQNYRLSLISFESKWESGTKISSEFSNPKRYSFFLGPDAKVNTPTQFLINKGPVKDSLDLTDRFNVEIVTREFFDEYKKLFDKLSTYLKNDKAFGIFASNNKVDSNNFSKKLLGQIVFLYFLQRKGWLGAKNGESISNGDKNFMRNYFNKARKSGSDYFNSHLEPLFYNALNQKPNKAGSFFRDELGCQIPFLNGGLFEPLSNYNWQKEFLNVPDSMFSSNPEHPEKGDGILDIFDLYNFTVDENDPTDKEVSVDPEMLGKVFENLLEENLRKGKGTYYTPREIVHYMCQESLINYLVSETKLSEKFIRQFIKQGGVDTLNLQELIKNGKDVLIDALRSIKIVDPACGSGAFLVGMLQEIVKVYTELDSSKTEYQIKKDSIQNSIYGVDIDPGAVDIAKLRLWLSLVVDYNLEDIEPLPNLDYKIMVGNSLVEVLSPQLLYKSVDQKRNELIDKFNKDKVEYFSISDTEQKRQKRIEINQLAQDLVNFDRKKEYDNIWQKILGHKNQVGLFGEENKQTSLADEEMTRDLKKLESSSSQFSEKDHFEWHLNFNDIFEKNGGFDVVIANPPYVSAWSMEKEDPKIREITKQALKDYHFLTGHWDLYIAFVAKGHLLLKDNGELAYIVPNPILREKYATETRKFLLQNMIVHSILEFNDINVFENVARRTTVIIATKKQSTENYSISIYSNQNSQSTIEIINKFDKSYWLNQPKSTFLIKGNDKNDFIIKNIEDQSDRIGNFFYVNYGVQVSSKEKGKFGKKEVVSGQPKGNAKEFYEGKDVQRWRLKFRNLWLDYREKDLYGPRAKELFECNKIVLRKISDKGHKLAATLDTTGRFTDDGNVLVVPYSYLNNTLLRKEFKDYKPIESKISLEYTLAMILSKLENFYFRNRFATESLQGATSHTYPASVRGLLIKNISINNQKPFINIVRNILALSNSDDYLKNNEKLNKVNEYETQIDQMIYKIFGLSNDEIKVVESSVNEK